MYDLPEMRAATDAFWQAIADRLAADGIAGVPARLDRSQRSEPHSEAQTPSQSACVFSQVCGYPLVTRMRDQWRVLGTPGYALPGCEGPLHRSFVIVRDTGPARSLEALHGTRFALNERDSNTGMNLPRRLFAPLAVDGKFFGSVCVTGSHAASIAFVRDGNADAAAIDCVTFGLLTSYRPAETRGVRILARTAATPSPAFVTARSTSPETVAALRRALDAIRSEAQYASLRGALFLEDIHSSDEQAYNVIAQLENEARELAYPKLDGYG